MTTKKRATTKKSAAKKAPQQSIFEKLEDSAVGTPIRIANKTFLASLGVVAMMQTEIEKFQTDFEKKFDQLVLTID